MKRITKQGEQNVNSSFAIVNRVDTKSRLETRNPKTVCVWCVRTATSIWYMCVMYVDVRLFIRSCDLTENLAAKSLSTNIINNLETKCRTRLTIRFLYTSYLVCDERIRQKYEHIIKLEWIIGLFICHIAWMEAQRYNSLELFISSEIFEFAQNWATTMNKFNHVSPSKSPLIACGSFANILSETYRCDMGLSESIITFG